MSAEKLIELLILQKLFSNYIDDGIYKDFIDENYDINRIQERYLTLGKEYLQQYALNKTEKSEENL